MKIFLLLCAVLMAGCSRSSVDTSAALRVGYFPNLTHAQALVGGADGTYARHLNGKVKLIPFNAGPAAMEALLGGSLDASYVGSTPAIIAFVRSQGHIHVVAGAASGGAGLVVREVRRPEDLVGKRLAVPQLGNTQDLALRNWLSAQNLRAGSLEEPGVQVLPLNNADALAQFRRGEIEGAWVPEPWAARMISEGGHLLVDERDLWWDRRFPITVLVVSDRALSQRPDQIRALLNAHRELTQRWERDRLAFAEAAHRAWVLYSGKPLTEPVVKDAFSRLEPLMDPLPEHLQKVAEQAFALGYLPKTDLRELVTRSP